MTVARLGLVGFVGVLVMSAAASAFASGMGGGGGGGMPAGGGGGGPTYNAADEYRSGAAAYKAGKYKDAARYFEHVAEVSPRTATVWFMLGMARANGGDAKGAARAYATSVKLDPAAIDSHREYALTL
ncbi:MAG: tetratricopeptide repeat protein, partial [Caulobacteraceae bacterium]